MEKSVSIVILVISWNPSPILLFWIELRQRVEPQCASTLFLILHGEKEIELETWQQLIKFESPFHILVDFTVIHFFSHCICPV